MTFTNAEYYAACNLTSNPFKSNATFDDDPRLSIWAGQTKERELLEKVLARSRADQVGNTNLILLFGHYGTGKSHALLWSARWLRGLGEGKEGSLAYYIPTLKKDKGRISFAGALRDDLIAKSALVADVMEFRRFMSQCLTKYHSETGKTASTDDMIMQLIPSVELQSFAKDLHKVSSEAEVVNLLSPSGQNDYQAMNVFTRLVNLFVYELKLHGEVARFKQSVHLMIDELDILTQASSKEVFEVNDLIRHLYDLCPNCFGLVLAISAEQELLPSVLTEYVLTRVGRQIEFDAFDRAASVDFAVQVLEENRVSADGPNGAFPFSDEALDAVLGQLSNRTPRRVVQVMQQLIEEARLANLDPAKGAITIEQLDSSGVMDNVT